MGEEQKRSPYFPAELLSAPLLNPQPTYYAYSALGLQSHQPLYPSVWPLLPLSNPEIPLYASNSSSVYPVFPGIPLDFSFGDPASNPYQALSAQFPLQQLPLPSDEALHSLGHELFLYSHQTSEQIVKCSLHLAALELMGEINIGLIKSETRESKIREEIFRRLVEVKSYLHALDQPPPPQNNILDNGTTISSDASSRVASDVREIPTSKPKRKEPDSVGGQTTGRKRIKRPEIRGIPQASESQTSTQSTEAMPTSGTLSIAYTPRFLNGRQAYVPSPASTGTQAESLSSPSDPAAAIKPF